MTLNRSVEQVGQMEGQMRGDMAAREQQMRYQTREGQEQLQREEEILCKQVQCPATYYRHVCAH